MKSSTATIIIVLLAIINIAGLTLFAEQIQSYLGASANLSGFNPAVIDNGYSDDIAELEVLLEQSKGGQQSIDNLAGNKVSTIECQSLLSECRNRCQVRHTEGATVDEVDTCYLDCESSYQFCVK